MALPDRIGSLIFCHCGSLLPLPGNEDVITCEDCKAQSPASAYENHVIVTHSHPAAFPSALRQKKSLVQPDEAPGGGAVRATIKEPCPQCKNDTVFFTTLQMRSADEGQTAIYDCGNCGYTWKINN